jgi:hypothetical protein
VTVRVDDAIWPWRGRRWAHLVSDAHLAELHDLAHRIGMPYMAFQGDHYDVHEDLRRLAIDLGAVATPARDLVRSLNAAGLRRRDKLDPWRWGIGAVASPAAVDEAIARTGPAIAERDGAVVALLELGDGALVRSAVRSGERLVVASADDERDLSAGFERLSDRVAVHRSVGERGSFVEVVVSETPTA